MSSLLNPLGVDGLSVDDRLRLVWEIGDNLEADLERIPLTEAQNLELDRRIATLDANPEAVTPWEVVEARAWSRIGR